MKQSKDELELVLLEATQSPSNIVRVPEIPAPKGVCWVRDTRIPHNFVGALCGFKKGHEGMHQWERENETP